MIDIYEIGIERAKKSAQKFKTEVSDFDRVFIMEEGEFGGVMTEVGVGVLGIEHGVVLLKEVATDKPFNYFDLLARALLSVVREMPNIRLRIKKPDPYFYRFGFKDSGGFLEIVSDNIDLKGTCGGH